MAIDKEIKNLSFIITVNDNCEIEIGKEYTDLLDLKPGDEFDIKLGRKNISLLRPGSKMFVWADDKENDTESNLTKEVNSNYKLENNYENKEYKSSYNYSYNNYSDYKKEEKKKSFSKEIFDDRFSSSVAGGIGWSIMMLRSYWLGVIVLLIIGVSIGELFKLFVAAGLVMALMLFIIPRPKR